MDPLLELCSKSRWLLGDDSISIGDSGKAFLNAAVRDLRSTQQALEMQGSPVLAFCGMTNVGKSTLLNAIFGVRIAPVSNGDWSARPVVYQYSKEQRIISADQNHLQTLSFNTEEELKDALVRLSTMDDPEKSVGKKHLVVQLDSPILQNGLIICDMPGFLATTGEADTVEQGTHDIDIRNFLEEGRSYLRTFIVSNAKIPDDSVVTFIRDNFQSAHLSIIINYRASENIDERKESLESAWRSELARALDFHYINAKRALREEEPEEREELIRHLQKYSDPDGRREIARQDLIRLFSDTGFFLRDFLRIPDMTSLFRRQRLEVVRERIRILKDKELTEIFNKFWR